MSFGWSAATWYAIGTAATVAVASDQKDQARGGQLAAQAQAKDTADAAERAANKANAKTPDVAALMAANMLAGKAGAGSTMLTGATGVDASQLTLGKAGRLGGG